MNRISLPVLLRTTSIEVIIERIWTGQTPIVLKNILKSPSSARGYNDSMLQRLISLGYLEVIDAEQGQYHVTDAGKVFIVTHEMTKGSEAT